MTPIYLAAKIQLDTGWNQLWSAITSGWPKLPTVLNIAAAIFGAIFVVKWFWNARKSQGGGAMKAAPWMWLLPAVLAAAPTIIIPLILEILSWIINMVVSLLGLAK